MRDDRRKWPAVQSETGPNVVHNGISVRQIALTRQTVLSGAFEDCMPLSGMNAAVGGGSDIAVEESYVLRQRRDRILVVNGPAVLDGWNEKHNVAVSDMTAAYAVIELSGEKAVQLIATGTEFNTQLESSSVSRLWHGFGILLYRCGNDETYRMHVRSAFLSSVLEMVDRQIDALSEIWMEDGTSDTLVNLS